MTKGPFIRAAVLILVYIAAFVAIVVLQFPAAGLFTLNSGGVFVRGTPGPDGLGLRTIEIIATGLRIEFSDKWPLKYIDARGNDHEPLPTAYRLLEDGIALDFDNGAVFDVRIEAGGRSVWRLTTPVAVTSATLHLDLAKGTRALPPSDDAVVRLMVAGSEYRISGMDSAVDQGVVVMGSRNGKLLPFMVTPVTISEQAIVKLPVFRLLEPAVWEAELNSWHDKAWAGVSGLRFNASTATWTDAQGFTRFSEPDFIMYMAEALKRVRNDLAAAIVPIVRANHLEMISWKAVPFAGRTIQAMARFEESDQAELRVVERLIQNKSPELFYRPDIIPFLFNRAPPNLAQQAMAYAVTADFSNANAIQVAMAINAFVDSIAYTGDQKNSLASILALVETNISPFVSQYGSAWFIQTAPDGRSDALPSLQIASALVRLSALSGHDPHVAMGQALILAWLKLAAPDGSIPAAVYPGGDGYVPSTDRLPASAVYDLIGNSAYRPRAVSLYRQLGPGSWVWTAAASLTVEVLGSQTSYIANWPVSLSHYMTVYGVKPFARIQLYGIDYNMDPSFEIYNASGYFYRRASNIIYVKMRHRDRAEKMDLFY
jgi:hypothetical protein